MAVVPNIFDRVTLITSIAMHQRRLYMGSNAIRPKRRGLPSFRGPSQRVIEGWISRGGIVGDKMTLADPACFSWINWVEWAGINCKEFGLVKQWNDYQKMHSE